LGFGIKYFVMGKKNVLPKRRPDSVPVVPTVTSQTKTVAKSPTVVLAIGEVSQWRHTGRNLPWDSQITFAGFDDVEAGFIKRINPDIVLSPLLCRSFDCLDLARSLQNSGFHGRYRIMSPRIPNPTVVLKELRSVGPSLDIDMIMDSIAATQGVN